MSDSKSLDDTFSSMTLQDNQSFSSPRRVEPIVRLSEYKSINDENNDDFLQEAIFRATKETAKYYYDTSDEFEIRRRILTYCSQNKNLELLEKLLQSYPQNASCRSTRLENLAADGQTPMHVCARYNNLVAMKLLVERYNASSWVIDIRGRTPLHIAAEYSNKDICEYLREQMKIERGIDPIGNHAPIDLAGVTPLGNLSAECRPKDAATPKDIKKILFCPGDKTILPITPYSKRCGKSPWKKGHNELKFGAKGMSGSNSDILFAYSEAQGWNNSRRMEDRLLVIESIDRFPTWSFYGVFDGHGGSFVSEYLAKNFNRVLSHTIADVLNNHDSTQFDDEKCIDFLERLLCSACERIEDELRKHPSLAVTRLKSGKLNCLNAVGSTSIISIVTPNLIATANIGDSRALLINLNNDKNYGCIPLSEDHKFSIKAEKDRAISAGAIIKSIHASSDEMESDDTDIGPFEVFTPNFDSRLRMSRAFGDFYLKQNQDLPFDQQAVIAVPEIRIHKRLGDEKAIVLACDGIYDVMTNEEVSTYVSDKLLKLKESMKVEDVAATCDSLLEEVLSRGSVDNVSVIIVAFSEAMKLCSDAIEVNRQLF